MSQVITFVVPVGSGGVRDYADIMANGLREKGFDARVFAWSQNDADALDAHIAASDCIYLQYSGYGYAKRGAPLWMLLHLQSRRAKIKRFGVFFHELYAFGPPWGSAFWLSPVQRHVAAGLARLADFWMTNRELSARWLISHAPDVPHVTLPVFSNVGEFPTYNPARDNSIVVFGSAPLRMKTWTAAGMALFDWTRQHGLELHDIGTPLKDPGLSARLEQHGVIRHGRLGTEQISRILGSAKFGLLAYPVEYVTKSSVFAAYCAHGVAPVLVSRDYESRDTFEMGRHYVGISLFNGPLPPDFPGIGAAAWKWYAGHSVSAHVDALSRAVSHFPT